MKVLVFNGSPRKDGNTSSIIRIMTQSMKDNLTGSEIEVFETNHMNFYPCQGCEKCKGNNGKCVFEDDTNAMVEKVVDADVIIFATPVYFWGVSAQLKLAIDKFYCLEGYHGLMKAKKVGVISVGGASTVSVQYELISKQFDCIFNHYGWNKVIDEPFSAYIIGDIERDSSAKDKISELWKKL